METITCSHCGSETASDYNFCTVCDKQIKCLNRECGRVLIAGKSFCLSCGEPLKAIVADLSHPNKYIRTVTQQGKNYSEHTELHASDEAVGALAPLLAGQIVSSARRTYEVAGISSLPLARKALPQSPQSATPQDALPAPQDESSTIPAAAGNVGAAETQSSAARHFTPDGEKLVAVTKDYKGRTWADQQRNFILLYSSAYQDHFGKTVPKETIKAVAEKTGVADINNFSRYVNKAVSQYFVELGTGLKLNPTGETELKRIVAAIDDSSIAAGFDYWNRAATPAAKRPRADKSKVNEWLQADVVLGKLDITAIRIARDYAILSLWIITTYLKKADAVSWNDAYYYLKGKYANISASPEAFSAAMRKDAIKKYVRPNDDGNFFLTPDGQQRASSWISGDAVPEKEGEDK